MREESQRGGGEWYEKREGGREGEIGRERLGGRERGIEERGREIGRAHV